MLFLGADEIDFGDEGLHSCIVRLKDHSVEAQDNTLRLILFELEVLVDEGDFRHLLLDAPLYPWLGVES